MRVVRLEQDMISEQKNLLGFMSIRQGIYIGITVLILYSFIPPIYHFFSFFGGIVLGLFFAILFAIPVIVVSVFLGFTKHLLTGYYRDKYYLMMFLNRHEYGKWQGGTDLNMIDFKDLRDEK